MADLSSAKKPLSSLRYSQTDFPYSDRYRDRYYGSPYYSSYYAGG